MPANTTPIFTITPRITSALVSAANTNLDGTGTVVTLFDAGGNGSTIENIRVKAKGTVTNGMVRIFFYNGSSYFLIHEISITATTPSGTVAAFVTDWVPPNTLWVLPTGWSVRVTTHNAEAFHVTFIGGDF